MVLSRSRSVREGGGVNAILDSALIALLIMAALGLLVVAAAVSDLLTRTDRSRPRTVTDRAGENWREDTQHFFHGNDRVRLSVALARSKNADRGVSAPGPQISKENDHADRHI